MRRCAVLVAVVAIGLLPAGSAAGKRHHHKHPAGVKGVVLNSTCPGACPVEPPPPSPYSGPVTITVQRASDGAQVASKEISDGHFRIRHKRGSYDVSAVPPSPPTCEPQPQQVCPPPCEPTPSTACPLPLQGAAIIAPCLTGETKPVKVRRHRMSHVELHLRNVCIV